MARCEICRTTIGWAELVMRLVALVVTLLTFILAAVGVAWLQPFLESRSFSEFPFLFFNTGPALGASGFVLAWSIIALIGGLIFLILRMVVFGRGGTTVKIIAGVEVAFTVVLSLGYFAGMIVCFAFFNLAFSASGAIFAAAFFSFLAWLLVMVAAIYSTYNVCCGPHKKENTPLTADERHDKELSSF